MARRTSHTVSLVAAITVATALVLGTAWTLSLASGEPTISVGSLVTGIGFEGTVSWDALKMPTPGLSAWTLDVVYDPAVVTAVSCRGDHGGICNPILSENTVRVSGSNVFGLEGDAHLADIVFACDTVGSTALTIVVQTLADATIGNPQHFTAALAHGSVTCTQEPPATPPAAPMDAGDANCDSSINGTDAALVLQLDAGLIDSVACPESADVNSDGVIDGLDAALILQMDAGLLDRMA